MGCKINWTSRAWLTYEANILYLQKEWTAKEISDFVISVDKKIAGLSRQRRHEIKEYFKPRILKVNL